MRYKAIEIVEKETGEVFKAIKLDPPKSERQALRTEDGVNRNLNHDRFFTELVESDDLL